MFRALVDSGALDKITPAVSSAMSGQGLQNLQSEGMPTPAPIPQSVGLNVADIIKAIGGAVAPQYKPLALGDTLYSKNMPENTLYERLTGQKRQYASGGSIDD